MRLEYYSINWRLRGELVFIILRLSDDCSNCIYLVFIKNYIACCDAGLRAGGSNRHAHCSAHVLISQGSPGSPGSPDLSDMMI